VSSLPDLFEGGDESRNLYFARSVDELQVLDVPSPMPSAGEVRAVVKAASLN
jgi:hypothetical protein